MRYLQFFQKRVIERTNGVPYLERITLFGVGENSSIFSIKIHKILVSDSPCLHDHPWSFLSIILKGGYFEYCYAGSLKSHKTKPHEKVGWASGISAFDHQSITEKLTYGKWFSPGSIIFRKARFAHRLELLVIGIKESNSAGLYKKIYKPCYTLVFTFKRIRDWGFFTRTGWVNWKNYNEKIC